MALPDYKDQIQITREQALKYYGRSGYHGKSIIDILTKNSTTMKYKKYIGTKIIEAMACEADQAASILNRKVDSDSPQAPGYLVVYEDGYRSWSPEEAFANAYREAEGLPFGLALEALKKGKAVRLPQWKEDVKIRAQFPDEHSKMTAPYLYVESRFGLVPWKETMIELFSEEWQIVE